MTGKTTAGAVRDAADAGPVPPPVWAQGARGDGGFAHVEVGLASGTGAPASADARLLAAHAKVIATLTGDTGVVVGRTAGTPTVTPCAMDVGEATWRDLTTRAEALLTGEHAGTAAAYPCTSVVETVPDSDGCDPPPEVVLTVSLAAENRLRLRYRTGTVDRDQAERIAGYHATALSLISSEPDSAHTERTLLSARELTHQREDLAGPVRELPDRRFHELFEDRVRLHPDAVAAVHEDGELSYGELNRRANRIAWALLDRGLGREDVVAVATERDLDWLASALAVLKAGCAYLPIDPGYPPARVASMLGRSGCGTVLTGAGAGTTLTEGVAAAGAEELPVTEVFQGRGRDDDPRTKVDPDQLAYIFFTSGSTGEPKGAMCEHAGMLNHLLAKIEDLELDASSVVAQTASQCFDISVWQLAAPLLVGGRTVIVSRQDILSVERVLSVFTRHRVTVAQLVPSFLEVLLSWVERHPVGDLPLVRMSVTGEAVKKGLVTRWFEAFPDVPLVNAYGLTETSDDTNHEVMRAAPEGDQVPLGRPVRNARVTVVDEQLRPVPLGAPGEIVFSGVCVGRGYVNDPDRTRRAFLPDPLRPGGRLYRSGDFGRWLPDGRLGFLGRRDSQVKVRGFRVELGEVENHLLRVGGVRDAAVVLAEPDGGAPLLAAFYMGDVPGPDAVREYLGRRLPEHMVPTVCHRVEALPVTENSKVDRAALAVLARDLLETAQTREPPRTETEQRLATAWAAVLRTPREHVGRTDHFFERGGTSLAAIRLVLSLDEELTHTDVVRHPVLADLAQLMDGGNASVTAGRTPGTGKGHDRR